MWLSEVFSKSRKNDSPLQLRTRKNLTSNSPLKLWIVRKYAIESILVKSYNKCLVFLVVNTLKQRCFHNSLSYFKQMPHFLPMIFSIWSHQGLIALPIKELWQKTFVTTGFGFEMLMWVGVGLGDLEWILQIRLNKVLKISQKWYLLM